MLSVVYIADVDFYTFFLISNKYALIKGKPSTLEVNKGKETTNKNYRSLGNQ